MSTDELYVLRKYVLAPNALAAIRLDRKTPVAEVVLLEEKTTTDSEAGKTSDAVGFQVVEVPDYED